MSEVKTAQVLKMRGYLDLTNLPKSQVKKVKFSDGKEHLIVNIAIFETEPSYNSEGKMTSDHYITCAPKKDERIKEEKYGIGKLLTWQQKPQDPTEEEVKAAPPMNNDDLFPWDKETF